MDEQTFTVELDFSGTFSIDVDGVNAREAYDKAVRMLKGEEIDEGSVAVRDITSFQIYDEQIQPCDLPSA